jgi:hypothetical protein
MVTHTYCGLLDDFAVRQGDVAIRSLQELNRHLIEAALFGDRLLINGGYILSNDVLQTALMNSADSPFSALVESGYVKILTRNDRRLEDVGDEMAQTGITSAKHLVTSDFYKDHYRPVLKNWSERLRSPAFDAFLRWPNIRIDAIFKAVAGGAYSSLYAGNTQHSVELDRFNNRLTKTAGRRTDWEDAAATLRSEGHLSEGIYKDLMFTASEAYQYSWGCALGTLGDEVRVLTRLPRHLPGLDPPIGQTANLRKSAVHLPVPNIGFAQTAIKSQWSRLAEMVRPGNELNILKGRFLERLETYYKTDSDTGQEVSAAAKAYSRALSMHFGGSEVGPVVFDLAFVGTSTAAGAAVAGPVGVIVVLAIGVVGVAAAHLGAPKLLWKLTAPSTKGWFRTPESRVPDNAVSFFQLATPQVEMYTKDVARFK